MSSATSTSCAIHPRRRFSCEGHHAGLTNHDSLYGLASILASAGRIGHSNLGGLVVPPQMLGQRVVMNI